MAAAIAQRFNRMRVFEQFGDFVLRLAGRRDINQILTVILSEEIIQLYDFLAENDSQNLIYIPATSKSKDKIAELLKHPHTVEALGDGGRHRPALQPYAGV